MVTREVGFQFLCLPLTIALLLITGCQTKDIPRLEKSPSPLVVGNIEVETHPPSRSKPVPAATGEEILLKWTGVVLYTGLSEVG